ncbi:MAG: helix-hairpin-helix domain-containing protein [Chitinophagaceae bacterium]|nr:helix-hairpin-helix domain-containing protein [Chitinophagaceae bacterium]
MANRTREYFSFSKKERIGIIVLLLVTAFVWVLPNFISYTGTVNKKEAGLFKQEVAAYKAKQASRNSSYTDTTQAGTENSFAAPGTAGTKSSLFYFDPNTLSKEGWQRLGLGHRTIQTIENYLSKGGRFYKPEDIGKIFGLKKDDYARLLPYVRIEKTGERDEKAVPVFAGKPATENTKEWIDINSADTTAFIKLPGIGSRLAARIVSFRSKLGGFHSVGQVAEVYGIHDTVFQKIKPRLICITTDVHKLNINTATLDTLKAHPYIKYQVGNAVIQYRRQHGNFESLDQLKEIHLISEEVFQKISPYITIR